MEITFLGTGAGLPAKERNVSAIALQLVEEIGAVWLFDCGEATQHQILHTSIRPRKIEKIFITHLHGDHIFGLPGLLGSRSFQGGETSVTVYGPKGIKDYIEICLKISKTHLKYPLKIVEIEEGILFEDRYFRVEAGLLDHGLPSYGYRITEKDLPGALLVDNLIELGVTPGPVFKKLKLGETITLENGITLNGKDYLGPSQPGRIVTILGDTRYCQKSIELAKNADMLIHEATFASHEGKLAHDYFHSTTTQAAEVAKIANAKKLVLNHISARYQREDSVQLEKEAKEIFQTVDIAYDFYTTRIERKGGSSE
ncbi:ribonuclease Z [Bacillus salitolerans]|uniref:Ribonuclease Z n=1 Tax=Bacillus salitolerans TaxID=1437434 RepID=A0ABW4LMD7_9BACI